MGTTTFSPGAGRYLLYEVFAQIGRGYNDRKTIQKSIASAQGSRSNGRLKDGPASRLADLLHYKNTQFEGPLLISSLF